MRTELGLVDGYLGSVEKRPTRKRRGTLTSKTLAREGVPPSEDVVDAGSPIIGSPRCWTPAPTATWGEHVSVNLLSRRT